MWVEGEGEQRSERNMFDSVALAASVCPPAHSLPLCSGGQLLAELQLYVSGGRVFKDKEDMKQFSTALEGDQSPVERDQMGETAPTCTGICPPCTPKKEGTPAPPVPRLLVPRKNLATHVKVCCQMGSAPGALLGGSTGMEMTQGGVIDSLWRFSHERKVDNRDLSINVEN
ncbi:hypothetical protein KUCAC02_012607 [Chaenocephalus aceratus]|uniref:Uncharacterized protein n=1 Tax=Chaenocephalus aceratus TaxID=36190 RepID=A0ACB9XD39_CHAAC|nr:hypothetical protein KUCAC02_012607 [Chaenocephalus aceratus]